VDYELGLFLNRNIVELIAPHPKSYQVKDSIDLGRGTCPSGFFRVGGQSSDKIRGGYRSRFGRDVGRAVIPKSIPDISIEDQLYERLT
jgi:hypothetical protein